MTSPTKPYDWTYTTTYGGHILAPAEEFTWVPADPDNSAHSIPMAELTRPDPIMYYAEIPLFEDELHDNGSSDYLIRIVSLSFYTYGCVLRRVVAGDADLHIHSSAFDPAS